ncbi:MAG: hypothetical protein AAGI01_06380 [Myxococcota bacterium]
MRKSPILQFLGEAGLWWLANILSLVLPLAAVYVVGTQYMHWGPTKLSFAMSVAGILTATWGSWAALIWTRSRGLRAMQQGATTLPGTILVALGGAMLYVGMVKWHIGALIVGAGLGMVVLSVLLVGGLFTRNARPSMAQVALGLTLFPVLTTAAAGGVAVMWYWFVVHPQMFEFMNLRELFTMATLSVSVMAIALTTTVIPAVVSRLSREVAAGALSNR